MNNSRSIHPLLRSFLLIAILVAVALGITWKWLSAQPRFYASCGVIEKVLDESSLGVKSPDVLDTTVESLTGEVFLYRVANRMGLTDGNAKKAELTRVAEKLRSHLSVSWRAGSVKTSGPKLIDIVAEENSPERAQQLAAAVIATFMDGFQENGKTPSRVAVETLRPAIEKVKAELAALEAELKNKEALHDEDLVAYNELKKRVDTAREFLATLTNHLKEVEIQEKEFQLPYRVSEEPLANPTPVRPNERKSMLIPGLAAFLVGVGTVLLIKRFGSLHQKA